MPIVRNDKSGRHWEFLSLVGATDYNILKTVLIRTPISIIRYVWETP